MISYSGEIESWRIIKFDKDTLTTTRDGKYLLEMQDWLLGQRKEIMWIRKK